jgi:hypothetical protein
MRQVQIVCGVLLGVGVYAWMSFALAAVLSQLGQAGRVAWVPVARYAAAARAADLSTVSVWTARGLATVGWATFGVAVASRAADATNASQSLVAIAALGFALGLAGSVVGWVLWILAANRIELRLVLERRLAWLAAIVPPLWATIVGFGAANDAAPRRITSDALGEDDSGDATRITARVAAAQAASHVQNQPPVAASNEPQATMPRGAGEKPMTTEDFDITGEYPRAFSPYDRSHAAPQSAVAPAGPPHAPAAAHAGLPWEYDEDDATLFAKRRHARWILRVVDGEEYPIEDVTTIGREGIRPIPGVLSIQDDTRTMSKLHARLRRESDNWFITDLGSTNGTYVRDGSGVELEVKAQTEAKVNGTLLLGDLEAIIVDQRGDA